MDALTVTKRVSDLELDVPMERDVHLGRLTWFGIGGYASLLAKPRNVEQLIRIVRHCREVSVPLYVLGKGANLLVADGTLLGVVVTLDSPAFRHIQIDPDTARVTCGGGADLERVITSTVRQGFGGLEGLTGIPARIGGAIAMNCGGAFGEIGSYVESVTIVQDNGVTRTLGRDDIKFGYRRTDLPDGIITEATFQLSKADDQIKLRDKLLHVMKYKKNSQPMAARSAGCTFKNPPKMISEKGAGQLIDEAGLKGTRIGGAEVSHVHANFIEVHDGGTATDVMQLMDLVQRSVMGHCGIMLEREVVVWQNRH
ncbi:MAG: UDP-N-acetylmuramate dehydrogenase [Phycisphaera sp.]|nr:UDP-N-acetylmuramate dehydrogenase [Phycisphaera sp.]